MLEQLLLLMRIFHLHYSTSLDTLYLHVPSVYHDPLHNNDHLLYVLSFLCLSVRSTDVVTFTCFITTSLFFTVLLTLVILFLFLSFMYFGWAISSSPFTLYISACFIFFLFFFYYGIDAFPFV